MILPLTPEIKGHFPPPPSSPPEKKDKSHLTSPYLRTNTITDAQLLKLADFFSVTPRPGILTLGEEK